MSNVKNKHERQEPLNMEGGEAQMNSEEPELESIFSWWEKKTLA